MIRRKYILVLRVAGVARVAVLRVALIGLKAIPTVLVHESILGAMTFTEIPTCLDRKDTADPRVVMCSHAPALFDAAQRV
jgi:hypothetical protein